jgi:3-methyladenine DNA glycosylase AlkD
MKIEEILLELEQFGNPDVIEGRKRADIRASSSFGVRLPDIKSIAKKIKINHEISLQLWESGNHDAMIMAPMVADPKKFTPELAEIWLKDMKSWDITDSSAIYLFRKCDWVFEKVAEWILREKEFQKRMGFVLIATLAVHGKTLPDELFINYLNYLYDGSDDKRNFVKKAVNWGIRQIGKKNKNLRVFALKTCDRIVKSGNKINWIALDAIKELNDPKTIARIEEVK